MSSDDSSDDDMPISRAVASNKRKALAEDDEDDDSSDDDQPISKALSSREQAKTMDDEDESDGAEEEMNGDDTSNAEQEEEEDAQEENGDDTAGEGDYEEEEEEGDDDDDDDDEDVSEYEGDEEDEPEMRDMQQTRGLVAEPPGSDDDSSDDDVPLSKLAPKKKAPAAKKKSPTTKAKAKPKAKAKTTKKKTTTTKKKKSKDLPPSAGRSSYVSASTELYSKSDKGKLIQSLLCRWWYAFEWPDKSSLPKIPPANADSLDGFPGMYVYTSGESVGKLIDLRDHSSPYCPSFSNMCHKTSEELRDLVIKAIEEQKRVLVEHHGEGTTTEKDLNALLKWATKVNTAKADRDADKVIKAARLQLPPRVRTSY